MSLYILRRNLAQTARAPSSGLLYRARFYSTKTSNPLRILFCGSDDFSIGSLKALHAEQQRDPKTIVSIDVLCRPGKKSGRGMKNIREVPIKRAAQDLGLPIHERDTFRGWDLPKPNGESINLIIAVSFGLFVPPRILNSAEYGGLNIHPSYLPDLRGPSPLQFMLLSERLNERIGVTLQTLDPKSFDHGIILAQERYTVPNPETYTFKKLLSFITPKAADILIKGIRDRLFVPPLVDVRSSTAKDDQIEHDRAPKISTDMKCIKWKTCDGMELSRRFRALGPLWTEVEYPHQHTKRWVLSDIELCTANEGGFIKWPTQKEMSTYSPSDVPYYTCTFNHPSRVVKRYYENDDGILMEMPDGQTVRIGSITVEGKDKRSAKLAMAELREQWEGVEEEFDKDTKHRK